MAKTLRTPRHERLRQILIASRKSAGMSQDALAEKLRRPQSFVAKCEGGERRIDVIEFCEMAEAMGKDPRVLLDELLA